MPRALAAALAILLAAAAPGTVLAHAALDASEPADGAVLSVAPARVALAFTGPMRVTSLRLLDAAGRERPLRREEDRPGPVPSVRAAVAAPLPPGDYRLEYRGLSADGHVGGGAVRFRVEAAPR